MKLRSTTAAALLLLSPDCDARIVTEPAPLRLTVLPLIVAGPSITVKLTSSPDEDVALNVKVDPSIIGGLVVKLGSRMVDSSLRTKLNSIKHAMKEAG